MDYTSTHQAAIGIIWGLDRGPCMLAEKKTPGYPAYGFVWTPERHIYNVPGGSWAGPNALSDKTPLGTYLRETGEELQPKEMVLQILKSTKPFGMYQSRTPKEVAGNKDMVFDVAVFESEVDPALFREAKSSESLCHVLAPEDFSGPTDLYFAFSYDVAVREFFESKGLNAGSIVHIPRTELVKLDADCLAPYGQRKLDHYRVNPLREKTKDLQVFRG